jgi:hypothetical protein
MPSFVQVLSDWYRRDRCYCINRVTFRGAGGKQVPWVAHGLVKHAPGFNVEPGRSGIPGMPVNIQCAPPFDRSILRERSLIHGIEQMSVSGLSE